MRCGVYSCRSRGKSCLDLWDAGIAQGQVWIVLTASRIFLGLTGLIGNYVHRSDLASATVIWTILRGGLCSLGSVPDQLPKRSKQDHTARKSEHEEASSASKQTKTKHEQVHTNRKRQDILHYELSMVLLPSMLRSPSHDQKPSHRPDRVRYLALKPMSTGYSSCPATRLCTSTNAMDTPSRSIPIHSQPPNADVCKCFVSVFALLVENGGIVLSCCWCRV